MCITFYMDSISIILNIYTKSLPHIRYIRRNKNVIDNKVPDHKESTI